MISIPSDVRSLIDELSKNGFEAYAVGGCVRDTYLGRVPNDWDITTSATPEQMQKVFSRYRVIETGLKHGTLTVMLHGEGYEITTYRKDGEYTDHRRPDSVEFVTDLKQDLERRDFTVNAMCLNASGETVDLFGGRADLKARIIRCVGDPRKRFEEDALRILRAVRFASTFDFEIDALTAKAALEKRETLINVSPERIFSEIKKLLCGKGAGRILKAYPEIVFTVFPELSALEKHAFESTADTLAAAPAEPSYRLALLFAELGEESVKSALLRLKSDTQCIKDACLFVREHTLTVQPDVIGVRRELVRLGTDSFMKLFPIWSALGCPGTEPIMDIVNGIIARGDCVSLSALALSGNDLAAIGIRGVQTGRMLKALLERVVSERVPNEKQALLSLASSLKDTL